jgi:hypothetical protein
MTSTSNELLIRQWTVSRDQRMPFLVTRSSLCCQKLMPNVIGMYDTSADGRFRLFELLLPIILW